ncbi:asparagine synthase (glutamine-hydrolysing) [Methylomarinovum caldicuralii]|uniref:asparagine synthase (glutamine-hydrolyzing) n=1 Tax=Methylomarinovum caldicuralii TaxID=438856 RepID=A0AAU9C0Q3_9GAMM|nr:asparagine synthase (glutamine-hydrolyzing) [Methylomarinovum caldicuralii]BCX82255.1 asparagine synthase (glutamine-hydrolysing) [Methylomarinovum caldicuralii]
MCGIAALFHYNNGASVTHDWLQSVNQRQQPRGPDGEGIWMSQDASIGLGHRRLAIIDLSERGAQPMASEDGKLRVVFNGEIYNHRELRGDLEARGHRFYSDSDTEVLLHLYREFGTEMCTHLRGMYAFALWDETRRGLLLARDPYGIKPLYYADDGRTLRAASQVKALLAAGGVDTSPEPAGHVGFFLWGCVPEPFTLYKGIRALAPGSTLWVQRGEKPQHTIFCDIVREIIHPSPSTRSQEARDSFAQALEDSVRRHLVADVPVGVFLSAGLDSTAIAALASQHSADLRTFTLGFEEYRGTQADETPLAESVARSLGASHTTRWVRGGDFENELETVLNAMDQPSIDGVNTYFVSKAASESGLKVALSGLGGDELLGGYPSFRHVPAIRRLAGPFRRLGKAFRIVTLPVIRRFTSPKYAGLFEYGHSYGGAYLLRRGLYMPWELPGVLDPDLLRQGWRELDPVARIDRQLPTETAPFPAVAALESSRYMRNMLLRDADWASMAHSLEIRVPLVDLDLLRAVVPFMHTPSPLDKQAMAGCAWKGKVPEALVNRPKTGFSIPVREWLRKETGSGERGLRSWARFVYQQCPGYPGA